VSGTKTLEDLVREIMGKRLEVLEKSLKEDIKLEGLVEAPGNRLKGHARELIEYISYKAVQHEKVPLAVHALATLAVYYTVAPVLSPICPQDYHAQVEALSYALGAVLNYVSDNDNHSEDTFSRLTEMTTMRLIRFADFIDTCQGTGLRPDAWQGLTGPLRDYYGKLFDYVYRMADKDIYVPLALNALGSIYTHLIAGRPYAGRCPDLLQTHLKGLERIVEDVVTLLHGGTINFTGNARPWLAVLLGLRLRHFLEFIAYCRGLDVRLSVELGDGLPEVTLLRVSPVPVLTGGGTP